jgi:hypothetical protein
MNMLRLASIGLVALGLVACKSSSDAPAQNNNTAGTFQAGNAKQSAQAVANAVAQIQAGNGKDGATALSGIGMLALSMIVPTGGAAAQAFDGLGHAVQADNTGTADCNETSCTFKGFGSSQSGSSYTLDGNMSWANGKLTCDLTFAATSAAYELDFHETCDLTITKTSLDGTFKTTGSEKVAAQGQNVAANWDVSETFTGVKFPEGGGCPTAGSLDASATLTAAGHTYSGSGSVTFDGKCY